MKRLDKWIGWLVPFGWLVAIPIVIFWPASWWYSLDAVVVTDQYTATGQRIIDIDRTIRRPFLGNWTVEEQIKLSNGLYATVQECHGVARYRTDKAPPEPITLDWWKGTACTYTSGSSLIPGVYRLCTFVKIMPDAAPPKRVERCSPDFTR